MTKGIGDPVTMIIGIFSTVILMIFAVTIISSFNAAITADKCKPYQDQITMKDSEIGGLRTQIAETNNQLGICNNNYQTLLKENITKKDFEEIKGYFNITQIQINNMNQRLDAVSTNYVSVQNNIINNYNLSLAVNIALVIELISIVFMKNELLTITCRKIKKVLGKDSSTEHHNSKEEGKP